MNSVHEQCPKQCTESKTRSSAQCAHIADPGCAHGAHSALRPVRMPCAGPCRGRAPTVSQPCDRPRRSLVWSCHRPRRPCRAHKLHVSHASSWRQYKNCIVTQALALAISQPWLCCIATQPATTPPAPLSRYSTVYRDTLH